MQKRRALHRALVLLGLPPPTQCKSDECRFGNPSSSGGLGDEDICCPDAWESADVINVELPEIVMQIAKELKLGTIPFREAIGECLRRNQSFTSPLVGAGRSQHATPVDFHTGEYHNAVLEHIRSYEMADQIHPNEFGYFEMAKQAVNVLNKALKASFWAKTDEAEAGARWTAGLAVVAVGGLFAVFAAISRKGRGAARVVKEGYGATDSTVDALLA